MFISFLKFKNLNFNLLINFNYLLSSQFTAQHWENGRDCSDLLVIASWEGPQASAAVFSANNMGHLPSGVLLGTFGDFDGDLGGQGTRGIAEICQ